MAETSLLPVIVGGLLTMGGGAVTGGITLAVTLLQSSREQHRRRSEKFEELVTSVYDFDLWLDERENLKAWGKEAELRVSPFAKIEGIAAVHFPDFAPQIEELAVAVRPYEIWIVTAGYKRVRGGEPEEVLDGLSAAYNPYVEKRNALLGALRRFAIEEFAGR
jgi:hypothetical protein